MENVIIEYPGDAILRIGRRVCRRGSFSEVWRLDPPRGKPGSWLCGELREVRGDNAVVATMPGTEWEETWALPLDLLSVKHSQEWMTDEQYLYGLTQMRALIAGGLQLVAVDSTDVGDKWTWVSWGFHEDRPRGMRPEFHRPAAIWPFGMPRRRDHQYCPLDVRWPPKRDGCFFQCMAFQQKHSLTQAVALARYDEAILRGAGIPSMRVDGQIAGRGAVSPPPQ